MKKQHFLLALVGVVAIGITTTFMVINHSGKMFANVFAEHDANCYWNHYAGKAATTGHAGCKEYWVCCQHHEIELVEPTVGKNLDAAALEVPSEVITYLDTHTDDVRYIEKLPDPARADEVIDFNEDSDLDLISDGGRPSGRNEFSWLESFEGETGVLKLHTYDDMPRIQLNSMAHEKSYYLDYEEIVFRVYLEPKGAGYHHFWFGNESVPMYYSADLSYNQWIELRFPTSKLSEQTYPSLTAWTDTFDVHTNIYVSDIRVESLLRVEIASAPDGVVNEEYTLPAVSVFNNVGEYTTDISVKLGDDPVTVTDGKFTPTVAGTYVMRVDVEDSAHNTASATADILILASADVARNDEVIDFNESSDINAISIGPRPADRYRNFEILDSYDGETGVLKFETCEDVIRIQIESMAHEMTHYTSGSYTKLVFRCWLSHKGANDLHHVYAFPEGWYNSYYFNGNGAGNIIYEQWYDYSFPLDALRIGDSSQGGKPSLGIYTDSYGTWANMYIADIRVE